MKSLVQTAATLLPFVLLVHATTATNLRCSNATTATSEESRCLQGGPITSKSTLLNTLIRALLPAVNAAIQAAVPEPLVLDLSQEVQLGSIDLGCGQPVFAGFKFTLADIAGLSTIFIDTLEVVSGTESISGCLNQPWSATFNMGVASTGTLAVNDLGAQFEAKACGLSLDETVGGDILTTNASLSGLVDLAGDLCAGVITINSATILETLAVGWDTITADLEGVPAVFSRWISDVTTRLSSSLQDQLVTVVEPQLRPIIQQELNGATAFAPRTALPVQAAVMRETAGERIESFVNAGSQFLGWGE